ncbi:fluoride efflux transporter CrcB [Alkalicoccobacillus plakortidis]|uniref:Fluoride-specific ion channel FluC n=1 Tax=Alkalicoccobacillus plakortidis TaxID=444060 RepID=A0ABT0XM90_9BACI|nr:fluoride efflux transporter CrcB [Alkalicoccobacillus plakortidis]MCM2677021.1 fluoride efflux transporter CrcB [Alkalicoccobacillus plakortidis]
MTFFYVGLAGGLGAFCRFSLSIWLSRLQTNRDVPIPILMINIAGSLLLGAVQAHLGLFTENVGLLISTGFLGAFTTFSTFSMESIQLIQEKKWAAFCWYIGLTVIGCIAAYCLGFFIL